MTLKDYAKLNEIKGAIGVLWSVAESPRGIESELETIYDELTQLIDNQRVDWYELMSSGEETAHVE